MIGDDPVATPLRMTPAEEHAAIRSSPTAGPSGLQPKRDELHAKLQLIKELSISLGMSCLGCP